MDNITIEEYNASRDPAQTGRICHAPFSSMFLTPMGDIYPCGVNRAVSLGKYPETTLHEAWFGKEAGMLRNKILHNDLSLGCDQCRDYLLMKNFWNIKARVYDVSPLHTRFQKINKKIGALLYGKSFDEIKHFNIYPSRIDFNLSNTCNLECKMCTGWVSSSILKNRFHLKDMDNPWGENFISEIQEFLPHLKTAFFAGGEPFLIKVYYDLWEDILKLSPDCKFIIQTNGTVLNDRVKKIIEKGNFDFNVSIDSVNKQTFESIRMNANFEKTMNNLDYFIDYSRRKKTFINLTVCPIQQNWKEIPELIEFANKKEITLYFNTVLYPQNYSFLGLNNEQIDDIIHYYSSFTFPENTPFEKVSKSSFLSLIEQLEHIYKDDVLRDKYLKYEKNEELIVENAQHEEKENSLIEEKKRQEAIEAQRLKDEQELLRLLEEEKLRKEQEEICTQQIKFKTLRHIEIKEFFISEITQHLVNNGKYNEIEAEENCKQVIQKLNELEEYSGLAAFSDILITIYNNVSLDKIADGLLTKDVKALYDSYLIYKSRC